MTFKSLDEDPHDDGKVLIAGALFDAETGEEIDDSPCDHVTVELDDDGISRFHRCTDCDAVVVASELDEDGRYVWETAE